ncbi:M23 family metallopeptidase [Archangium sp.]|uniref:M23 family metallopeptidase n=1 Tax=Archangium sp. TaxID=1872627 RepID=UPI002D5CC2CD|nr:M23 family metallopeptidase [Archangium sp.]HYO55071.1 M23 family metallopeptidase [Archangium sp.]
MHIYSLRRLPFLLLALGLSALAAEGRPLLSLQPTIARPGDPVLITVRGLSEVPTGTLGERPLRFYPVREGFQALTGLPVELTPGQVAVKVTVPATGSAAPRELLGKLDVVAPGWPSRTLKVANKFVVKKPAPQVQARMEADKAAFAAAFAQSFVAPLFGENFAWPRQDRITAPYGDLRTFNGKKQSQHFGTDIDGDPGTPVYAANAGTVVMSRDNYAAGNTVLVHHGAGLYTAYFHLSAIDVREGARVERGQLLGKVGGTGRVTGPHLHWGVKVDDLWVDGETLLKLDFTGAPAVTQRDKE